MRYLEQFPSGGCFHGRNFVFDERVAHGPADGGRAVLGRCAQCKAPHDDYAARHRCSRCRLLMLVCPGCATQSGAAESSDQRSTASDGAALLVCELCDQRVVQRSEQGGCTTPSGTVQHRPLKLLALHGFRENASRFRGRLRGLLKRWGSAVNVEFIEAPHELAPALARTREQGSGGGGELSDAHRSHGAQLIPTEGSEGPAAGQARQQCLQGPGKPKRAWFVERGEGTDTALTPHGVCCAVLACQTEGFLASVEAVSHAVAAKGPFDGVIAFSQGCAMAAAMVALQQLRCGDACDGAGTQHTSHEGARSEQVLPAGGHGGVLAKECTSSSCTAKRAHPSLHARGDSGGHEVAARVQRAVASCNWQLRFVMLCSGHVGASREVAAALVAAGPLRVPSLHVFGRAGVDRQVDEAASRQLAACFAAPDVTVHERGHVLPSAKADAAQYLRFFQQQCGTGCDGVQD